MITIKCPKCQADNLYDAEFCRHCGIRLAKDCPECNIANPHQFTYCTQCGHSLVNSVIPVPVVPEVEAKEETKDKFEAKEEAKLEAKEEEALKDESKEEIEIKEEVKAEEETSMEAKEEAAAQEEPKEQNIETEDEIEKISEEIEVEAKEEIKVDIKTPPRVSTGIEGLDPLIGNGFLAGKVYLVSGESGTGKTIFGLQYLYHGLTRGENGIYVSGEENPIHLIVDAESLDWDLRKYVEERKLGLLDISHHFAETHTGKAVEVDVRTMVNNLTKHIRDIGAKRIVIDTIAPLVFGQESLTNIQEYIKNLVFAIEDNLECTVLMTSGILSGSTAFSRYGVEEFVAEGVIVLGMLKFNGFSVRKLSIKKMRSTASDISDHTFEILPQKGIVIKQ